LLARPEISETLLDELLQAKDRRGWMVGRYVVMPDHLHFFCAQGGAGPPSSVSQFVGQFKQWTSKRIAACLGAGQPIWQREFFDHLLRSNESYEAKCTYVRDNPVRAGLVTRWEDWPYAGEIEPLGYP
jgi:putative transposase